MPGATVKTLRQLGIDGPTASRAVQLARIDKPTFDRLLAEPRIASDRWIIKQAKPKPDPPDDQDDEVEDEQEDGEHSDSEAEEVANPTPSASNDAEFERRLKAEVAGLVRYLRIDSRDLDLVLRALDPASPDYAAAAEIVGRFKLTLDLLTEPDGQNSNDDRRTRLAFHRAENTSSQPAGEPAQ